MLWRFHGCGFSEISRRLDFTRFELVVVFCNGLYLLQRKKLFDDDREVRFVGIKDENLECSSEFLLVQ